VFAILAYYSGMQSASSLRSVILSSVTYSAIYILLHWLTNGATFGKKKEKKKNKKCVLIFSTTSSEALLFLRMVPLGVIINVHRFICKEPIIRAIF